MAYCVADADALAARRRGRGHVTRRGSDVAVITGGASGFGLALAETCAARGMSVVLLDLDGERAATEAQRLTTSYDATAAGRHVDVADAASVEAAAKHVAEEFGRADV